MDDVGQTRWPLCFELRALISARLLEPSRSRGKGAWQSCERPTLRTWVGRTANILKGEFRRAFGKGDRSPAGLVGPSEEGK